MASSHVFSGALPRALPGVLSEVLSDAAIKAIYFSLVATAFAFASILLTGVHP
jgi:nitrate/nitrite transporter NarK